MGKLTPQHAEKEVGCLALAGGHARSVRRGRGFFGIVDIEWRGVTYGESGGTRGLANRN